MFVEYGVMHFCLSNPSCSHLLAQQQDYCDYCLYLHWEKTTGQSLCQKLTENKCLSTFKRLSLNHPYFLLHNLRKGDMESWGIPMDCKSTRVIK